MYHFVDPKVEGAFCESPIQLLVDPASQRLHDCSLDSSDGAVFPKIRWPDVAEIRIAEEQGLLRGWQRGLVLITARLRPPSTICSCGVDTRSFSL